MKIPVPVRIMLGVFIIVIFGFPAAVTVALLAAYGLMWIWWFNRAKPKPEVEA